MASSVLLRKFVNPNNIKCFSSASGILQTNHERDGFKSKTTGQLFRGFFVLKLSTYETFVKHAERVSST